MADQKTLKSAIVGTGTIFERHRQAYVDSGVEVFGIADIDLSRAQAAASKNNISLAVSDWKELVARSDIDIIDICTPPKFHAEIAIAALDAGKHVICEKPLAPNLAGCDEIVEAAKRSTGLLTVCHQFRSTIEAQRMKWLMDVGHLGKPCMARVRRYDAPPMNLVRQNRWGNWIDDGCGVLMTKAIHQLDLLIWLFGPVRRVQAMMGTLVCSIESEDHLVANLEFENGALASVSLSGCPHVFLAEMEIVGDQGIAGMPWNLRLKVNNAEGSLASELNRRFPFTKEKAFDKLLKAAESMGGARVGRLAYKVARRLPVVKSHVTDRSASNKHSHSPLIGQFIKAIEGQAEIPVTAIEARNAVELCMAIYISALTSESVKLPLENKSKFYGGIDPNEVSECEHASSSIANS